MPWRVGWRVGEHREKYVWKKLSYRTYPQTLSILYNYPQIIFHSLTNLWDTVHFTKFCSKYQYLISEGRWNCANLWPLTSTATVTHRKHVTKYKHTRKWMFEFFCTSESFDNKFSWVNSIRITKSINLLYFRTGVTCCCLPSADHRDVEF